MDKYIVVRIPRYYRDHDSMAEWIGPFNSVREAEKWVSETFVNYTKYVFEYIYIQPPVK